jgi:hypothetical protein
MQHIARPLALLLLAAACGDPGGRPDSIDVSAVDSALRPGTPAPAGQPAAPSPAAAWRTNPADGVTLTPGTPTVVETGPHALLWQEGAPELAPPYVIRAEMRKRAGRLHEGYGIVFGGAALEGEEAAQAYSYFLVRGDGSFLVKRRAGTETPVVRDWTRHPRINRDADGTGRSNVMEVRVDADSATFVVNGAEVARVPSAELAVRGRAGLRIAHDVVVEVLGYSAGPATDSAAADSVAP